MLPSSWRFPTRSDGVRQPRIEDDSDLSPQLVKGWLAFWAAAHGSRQGSCHCHENRSKGEVSAHMPFLMSQARSYGIAMNYFAISHPSLPNYLVLAGGTTFGIADDGGPAVHRLRGPSVFGRLLAAGRTATTYAEAMPDNCSRRNHAIYAVRHNPWTYFDDPAERAACEKFDVPLGSPTTGALIDDLTAGKLPTFGLVVPNLCN